MTIIHDDFAGWSMVINIETTDAEFMLSVQPRFVPNKGMEQSAFVQHHGQCAPISVVVKCFSLSSSSSISPIWRDAVTKANLSTLWKAVFRGLKPAAITLAVEDKRLFETFVGKYRKLLDEETEELRQIGGAVRFACGWGDENVVVEGSSQSVTRWYVVDGRTMQVTGMYLRCFARGP